MRNDNIPIHINDNIPIHIYHVTHSRAMKPHASLSNCTDSPEPTLIAYTKYMYVDVKTQISI